MGVSCSFAAAYAAKVFDEVLSTNAKADTDLLLTEFSKGLMNSESAKIYVRKMSAVVADKEIEQTGTANGLNLWDGELSFALRAYPTMKQLARWFADTNGKLKTNAHALVDIGHDSEQETKKQHHVLDGKVVTSQLLDAREPDSDNRIASLVKTVMDDNEPVQSLFYLKSFLADTT